MSRRSASEKGGHPSGHPSGHPTIPGENAAVRSSHLPQRLLHRVALDHGAWAGAPLARHRSCSLSLASWDRPSIRVRSDAPTPPRDPVRHLSRQLPPCNTLEVAGCATGSALPPGAQAWERLLRLYQRDTLGRYRTLRIFCFSWAERCKNVSNLTVPIVRSDEDLLRRQRGTMRPSQNAVGANFGEFHFYALR
jgi:hypothetical protein